MWEGGESAFRTCLICSRDMMVTFCETRAEPAVYFTSKGIGFSRVSERIKCIDVYGVLRGT